MINKAFFNGLLAIRNDKSCCMIKIFRGGMVVDGEGGSSKKCSKWGGGGGGH